MSFSMFMGFVTGNLIALAGVAAALLIQIKRGKVEQDERTALINAQSSAWAFYLTGVVAYAAWVIDNVLAYRRGEPARFASPWGIMLLLMFLLWGVSRAYHVRRFSARQWDEIEVARAHRSLLSLAGVLVGDCIILLAVHNHVAREAVWLLGALLLALAGKIVWIISGIIGYKMQPKA